MKTFYRNLISKLNEQKKNLRAEADTADTVDKLKDLEAKLGDIDAQITAAEAQIAEIEKAEEDADDTPADDTAEDAPADDTQEQEEQASCDDPDNQRSVKEHKIPMKRNVIKPVENEELKKREAIGSDLKLKRSVTVASSSLVVPKHYKDQIDPAFRQYSTLVDSVNQVPLNGGESYTAPYEVSVAAGINGTEGTAPASNSEPTFGYADINKSKIVAYAEISEEVKKLPNADYATRVIDGITTALKKKISQEIMTGDGSTNHFQGIFSTGAGNKCVRTAKDIAITAIDENTLMSIIGQVGGDEEIEGNIALILSKSDVMAFAQLRDAVGGQKIHTVDFVNQTIDGVKYFINSNCNSVAAASTGDYCMAAGILSSYEEALFSDIEVTESTDYKFKEGMICYRGVVFAGGNTTKYDGFVRVKKGA